ncbi:MAG: prepilin-type N-terminal cleavage/methylation domain-containing protein [Planctomycetota bacterium]|nr:prepilin-type N-terminal cleavage/methylation domain-containing protein [Planctomycetota bacterium]
MRVFKRFTLIELMVVVAIIGICSAFLIPSLLAAREKAEKQRDESGDEKKTALVQEPIRANVFLGEGKKLGAKEAPDIVAADINVQLKLFYVLSGFSASTHYSSKFDATFCIRRRDSHKDQKLSLDFPFPPGLTEARGVKFRLYRRGNTDTPIDMKKLAEISDKKFSNGERDSVFSQNGIQWEGELGLEEELLVRIHYDAEGRDAFRYAINSGGRSRYVNFQLKIANSRRAEIPPPSEALKPVLIEDYVEKEERGQRLVWTLEDVITGLPVIVELPSSQSPIGKMVLLGQLAGLAILIFGAGFFYLSEGYKPGQLDSFGWSHFLLLSVTYFMFFPVFAVTETVLGFWPAMGLGSIISLPLFTYHVARYTDKKFALTRNLPFSVLTLIFVISGVYLADYRPYVYTTGAVIIIFYLTIDLRAWIQKTDQFAQERNYKYRRELMYQDIELKWEDAKRSFNMAEGRMDSLLQIIQKEDLPANFDHLATTLERLQGQLSETKAMEQSLEGRWQEARKVKDSELNGVWGDYSSQLENLKKDLDRLVSSRRFVTTELESSQQQLDAAVQIEREQMKEKQQELLKMLSAIHIELGESEILFREFRKEIERGKGKGADAVLEMIQAEEQAWDHLKSDLEEIAGTFNELKKTSGKMALSSFLERSRSLTWGGRRLKEKVEAHTEGARLLESRWKTWLDNERSKDGDKLRALQSRFGESEKSALHCSACGESAAPGQRYCAQCSLELPESIACAECGDELKVLKHLVGKRKWAEAKLHCISCGESVKGDSEGRPESVTLSD